MTINPIPLVVVIDNATRGFGEANPVFTYTVTGQNPLAIFNIQVVSDAGTTTAPGIYAPPDSNRIRLLGWSSNINYSISSIDGTLTILPAQTISGFAAFTTHTYGDAAFSLGTVTGGGSGNPVKFASSQRGVATVDDNGLVTIHGAGSTDITATQAGNADYAPAPAITRTLYVGKALLRVEANPASRTYGEANPVFTGTVTGSVGNDNITASYVSNAVVTTAAGTYPDGITPMLDANVRLDENYTIRGFNNTLTITPAPLTVVAADANWIFGTTKPTFSGTLTGLVAGDVITATFDSRATAATAIGVYDASTPEAITPTLQDPGTRLGNYALTTTKGTLTIANEQVISGFAPFAGPVTYGAASFLITGVTGGATGNSVVFSSSNEAVATVSGSTVTVTGVGTAVITATQAGDATYLQATSAQVLTVTPAPLTVTSTNASRTVGTANPVFTGTVVGVVGGDGITATYVSSATADTPVGIYDATTPEAITPTLVDANARLSNYVVTMNKGTLVIIPAEAAAQASAAGLLGGGESSRCSTGGLGVILLGLTGMLFGRRRRR